MGCTIGTFAWWLYEDLNPQSITAKSSTKDTKLTTNILYNNLKQKQMNLKV
jgi:hypothetical protein